MCCVQMATYTGISWNVQTLLKCMYIDVSSWCSFLICPAGRPIGRSGCCQVSHLFKFKHTSLIGISLSSLLLDTQWASAPAFPIGLGAGAGNAGSFPPPAAPAASALAFAAPAPASTEPAGGGVSGVRALVAGVVLLVLESALDNPGLVVTDGALNPIDVLVVGGQDGLQLLLEGVRFHCGVCIYHCALVPKCSCIDAVFKRNRNWFDDESIQMLLYSIIFQPTKYSPYAYVDPLVCMTKPMKQLTWVQEYPSLDCWFNRTALQIHQISKDRKE